MKTEIKIIKTLLENRETTYIIRELAKKTGSDYRIIHTAVNRLSEKKLIEKKTVGRAQEIKLTNRFSKEVFEAEYERREELLKNNNFKVLKNRLDTIPFPFITLVFGSHVKGETTKKSDIDLMIICEKNRQEEIENIISLLPLDIHLVTLTYAEFLEMTNSKEFTVVSEVMKSNIILVGIENYYRLIGHVG